MDFLLYAIVRPIVALLQALPLRVVARLGRAGGALAYWLDARHRRVAVNNLTRCFPEKSAIEVRALARENLRRIGENFASAVKTAAMTAEELKPHVEFVVPPEFQPPKGVVPPSVVVAIGHFGNFELYARFGQFCGAFQGATTYRGLRQPSLNRLVQSMREKSGCLFFDRRFDAEKLKAAMNQPGMMLGLLCDQAGRASGLQIPFLGHNASTSPAVAVFALRYKCPLYTGICYRTGLAHWRIEAGGQIPTHENGEPRSAEAIMRDVNAAFESAIRRDPANWFWVHNRWKRGVPPASSGGP
ncbi:MAG: lipopolysaccharide heptosyltransferase, partial [Verrucomicrobiota bacterium]